MKKVSLFLAVAAMIGVSSAFATKSSTGEDYVRLNDGTFELKSTALSHGSCANGQSSCTYIAIVEEPDTQNPDDFMPADQNRVWVEN